MAGIILKAVVLFAFVGAFLSALLMIYYTFVMFSGVKPEKRNWMNLLGPLSLFLPSLWNDEANSARLKLLISIFFFAFCFLLIKLITAA